MNKTFNLYSFFILFLFLPFSSSSVNSASYTNGIVDIVGVWEGIASGVTEESIRLAHNNLDEAISTSEMQMEITQATDNFCIAVFRWMNPEAKKINYDGEKYTNKGSWTSICLYDQQKNNLYFQGNEAHMTCDFPEMSEDNRKKLHCNYLRSSFEHHSVAKFHLIKVDD